MQKTDNMKSKLFTLSILLLVSIISVAQSPKQTNALQQKPMLESNIYQLFPTQHPWTFIKLDTRNGKIWQVHFTVKDNDMQGEFVLNMYPLISKDKEVNGRFTLYPTENIYNFLLLDQVDGSVYQVQWSMDERNRGIMPVK